MMTQRKKKCSVIYVVDLRSWSRRRKLSLRRTRYLHINFKEIVKPSSKISKISAGRAQSYSKKLKH